MGYYLETIEHPPKTLAAKASNMLKETIYKMKERMKFDPVIAVIDKLNAEVAPGHDSEPYKLKTNVFVPDVKVEAIGIFPMR